MGYILDRLVECIDQIKHRKVRRFCEYIKAHGGKTGLHPFHEITQPVLQIESILEQIRDALSDIFGIPRNDIGLSVLYRTSEQEPWRFLYTMNIEQDISLNELIHNPQSSARQIIDGRARSLFYANKSTGVEEKKFVPGQLDKERGLGGSIICRDISISTDHNTMRAVLSITTYGQSVCDEKDQEAQKKITEIILPSFELRLRNELALQYIKEVLAVE